jgi:glycosyltransferase involved in cell wall biosynthesis
VSLPRTLFLTSGTGAVAWYRCALPAMALGADWAATVGPPQQSGPVSGTLPTDYDLLEADHEVIVVQEAHGDLWEEAIQGWQAAGCTVLYEVDDWLHGVADVTGHALATRYNPGVLRAYEACMRAADGLLCSTRWLADTYAELNPNTYVCRNGIDPKRFALTPPAREHVTIGWSGGTGHESAVGPWMGSVAAVLRAHPHTRFLTVGEPFGAELAPEFGQARARAVPFTDMEVYPAAMTHFDIALAPAGPGGYFRAKSDLRWLEASALGIPVIGDPAVYPDIEHGVTGFHAATPAEAQRCLELLVSDPALRAEVGARARAHVLEHRSIGVAAAAWSAALARARSAAPIFF